MEAGRVRVTLRMGIEDKTIYVGQSLNDDIYHTLIYKRRGTKIEATMDDDQPILGKQKVACRSTNLLSKLRFYS